MQERPAEGWRSLLARVMIGSGRRAAAQDHPGAHPMVDQIIGLILAILALIYLAFAMLRPERF